MQHLQSEQPKVKRNFSVTQETLESIDAIREKIRKEYPNLSRLHSRTSVLELTVNHAMWQLNNGKPFREFFEEAASAERRRDTR